MGRIKYRVDYHLISVVYFALEDTPPPADIASLWQGLSSFGELAAEVTIMSKGQTQFESESTALGSPLISQKIHDAGDVLSLVTASVVRPDFARDAVRDSDLNFVFKRNPVWQGERTLASIQLSISGQILEDRSPAAAVVDFLKSFFELSDRCRPPYGFVDLSTSDDSLAGMVYSTTWPAHAPLHRWAEQYAWVYSAAKKGDRVRGLYWGNYFGQKILAQLGGRDSFLRACRGRPARRTERRQP